MRKSKENKCHILKTSWDFLKVRKNWWLLPLIILLILLAILIVIGEMYTVTPYIYPLV